MKNRTHRAILKGLLTPEICRRLFLLHEYRGRQELLTRGKPLLETLREDIAIESAYAVCELSGRGLAGRKFNLDAIRGGRCKPTKSQKLAAGFLDAFQILEGEHGTDRFDVERISEIQTELFFTYADNFEREFRSCEIKKAVGIPFPAEMLPSGEIENRLGAIVGDYLKMRKLKEFDELLVIAVFLVDFICIYPYGDGFPCLFLLIARLLLKRAGYLPVDYVSFARELAKREKEFREAVFNSTVLWNQGEGNYGHFTLFFLDVLLTVCEKYEKLTMTQHERARDAKQLVVSLLKLKGRPLSKGEIAKCIASVTPGRIKQILGELVEDGAVSRRGEGKNTAYHL